jgi:hypothetical protein
MFKKLLLLGCLTTSLTSAITITLTPASTTSGAAGTSVGWGIVITNPNPTYVIIAGVRFLDPTSNDYPQFTDFLGSQFPQVTVGPAPYTSLVSQNFDLNLMTGAGSFAIPSNAVYGSLFQGTLEFTYDTFTNDPVSANPGQTGFADLYFVDASVLVAPEPATLAPLGLALAVGLITVRRRAVRG